MNTVSPCFIKLFIKTSYNIRQHIIGIQEKC